LSLDDITKEIILEKHEIIQNVWQGNYESQVYQAKASGIGSLVLTNMRLIWIQEDYHWFGKTTRYVRFDIPRQEITDVFEIGGFWKSVGVKTSNGIYKFIISIEFRDFMPIFEMSKNINDDRNMKMELLKNYETAGRFEDAAKICDEFEMWEKAGEYRRMAKTTYQISTSFVMGKDGAISCSCPNCGSSQTVETKSNLVKCQHCGNSYIIPKKILDLM